MALGCTIPTRGVVSNFAVQALRGDSITIYGDGSQSRSFCYVDDLVDGLMRLMASDASVPRYFRPTEVDLLIGDPTKAQTKLGWKYERSARDLAHEMVTEDLMVMQTATLMKDA